MFHKRDQTRAVYIIGCNSAAQVRMIGFTTWANCFRNVKLPTMIYNSWLFQVDNITVLY